VTPICTLCQEILHCADRIKARWVSGWVSWEIEASGGCDSYDDFIDQYTWKSGTANDSRSISSHEAEFQRRVCDNEGCQIGCGIGDREGSRLGDDWVV